MKVYRRRSIKLIHVQNPCSEIIDVKTSGMSLVVCNHTSECSIKLPHVHSIKLHFFVVSFFKVCALLC